MSSRDAKKNGLVAGIKSLGIDTQTRIKASKYNEELPVSQLPFDVLSNIFLLCQRTLSIEEQYNFPEVVSHVCRQWRATALSTGFLWNIILLIPGMCNVSKLEAHLIRSGTCFLDIYLLSPAYFDRAVMDHLVAHCRRWRRFYAIGEDTSDLLLAKCLREIPAPVLEYIYLDSKEDLTVTNLPAIHPAILLQGAPSLKFAHLSGLVFAGLQPPLTNITSLELSSIFALHIKPADFVRFFGGLRSLVTLSLFPIGLRQDDYPFAATPVTLPLLRALRICGPCHTSYLSFLVLPCLDSLVLREVYSIQLPSLRSVKNLIIERPGIIEKNELANIAWSCPSLTHLNVGKINDICQYWLMSIRNCPSLQKITVRNTWMADLLMLRSIVSARIARGHPLEELFLSERSRIMLRDNARLDRLKESVTVTFSDEFEGWSTISGFSLPLLFDDRT